MTPPQTTLRLVIHGRVQGVFFRDSMRREAQKLGIAGWVRNCTDGTVEAVVQGPPAAVESIALWAHRGPPSAQVEKVDRETASGAYDNFEILY